MRDIPIYRVEAALGLAEKIRTSARVTYASKIELVENNEDTQKRINEMAKSLDYMKTHATNEGQIDLHYIKSILATVGWNKNDDVFDRMETWMARATPEDKPFNYEHNSRDIIGHITNSYIVDFKGNIIPGTAVIEEVPEEFHVGTGGVLYKFWPEPEYMERMKNIIAEIAQSKWFVSMECLFDNFDYAVVTTQGSHHIIPRNEESAFITKHLRAYGGSGVYEGNKVGRLLRNVVFSGKGLVRRPANPYSDIFDAVATFNKAVTTSVKEITKNTTASGYSLCERQNSKGESNRMAATEVELLQNENKRLEQTLTAAVTAQKDAEKRLTEMNEQTVKAKIDGLTQDVKGRDEKINSLTTQVQTEQKARTDAEAKVAELEKKNAELQVQIAKAEAEGKKVARIAVITAELALSAADAQKFYEDEVADLNLPDDRFNKLVATFKKNKGATQSPPANNGQQTNASDNSTTSQPGTVLDNAQPAGKNPPLGTDGVSTTVEQSRAKLANFLGQNCLRRTAKKNKGDE